MASHVVDVGRSSGPGAHTASGPAGSGSGETASRDPVLDYASRLNQLSTRTKLCIFGLTGLMVWICVDIIPSSSVRSYLNLQRQRLSNYGLPAAPIPQQSEPFQITSDHRDNYGVGAGFHSSQNSLHAAGTTDPYSDVGVLESVRQLDKKWRADYDDKMQARPGEDGMLLRYFTPSYHCDFEERLGSVVDGGKWLCRPRSHINTGRRTDGKGCLIYSFGSNQEMSFEASILTDLPRDCEIHIFDPTVSALPLPTGAEDAELLKEMSARHGLNTGGGQSLSARHRKMIHFHGEGLLDPADPDCMRTATLRWAQFLPPPPQQPVTTPPVASTTSPAAPPYVSASSSPPPLRPSAALETPLSLPGRSLVGHIHHLNHSNQVIDVLKIDIEEFEWFALRLGCLLPPGYSVESADPNSALGHCPGGGRAHDSLRKVLMFQVKQLLVELHLMGAVYEELVRKAQRTPPFDFDVTQRFAYAKHWLNAMELPASEGGIGFNLFHVETNYYSASTVLEVAFVNSRFFKRPKAEP